MSKVTTLMKAAGMIGKPKAKAIAKATMQSATTKKSVATKATATKSKLRPYEYKVKARKDAYDEYYATFNKNGKRQGKKGELDAPLHTGNYGEAKDTARALTRDTNKWHRTNKLGMERKPKASPARRKVVVDKSVQKRKPY